MFDRSPKSRFGVYEQRVLGVLVVAVGRLGRWEETIRERKLRDSEAASDPFSSGKVKPPYFAKEIKG